MPHTLTPESIRDLRRRLGLTQTAFAALIGCHWLTVSFWETGRRHPTGLYARAVRDVMAEHATGATREGDAGNAIGFPPE